MLATLLWTSLCLAQPPRSAYFAIEVVDDRTGRGVPLVELRTVSGIRLYTDSNGLAAFDEPGLMGRDVFFFVTSHGYEFPKDGFGFRGKPLRTTPGETARLKIRRVNLAERLYRITGGGIYRDSVLLGAQVPVKEPVLNAQVLGSDSVISALYRGKMYWFWGDTNRPGYPLGNFHVPGAVSSLPGQGGLDPEVGIDLTYFTDPKGFASATARMPGKGPTWLTTAVPLLDEKGQERLYGSYVQVVPPLTIYARGLAVFDDTKHTFSSLVKVPLEAPIFPAGHPLRHKDADGDFVYFSHPFPLVRVPARGEAFARSEEHQAYTCLREGTRVKDGIVERDAQGRPAYAWRKNAPPLGTRDETDLIARGKLKADEARWRLHDRDSGKVVTPHAGSVSWNAHRRRWVMIVAQSMGTSLLGEIWYAEADTPVGPWAYAVKVVTHDRYSFYNPKHHPAFDKDGGRRIFFEGTYTHTFSGNPDATPRYDYNQILYSLDLGDPRAALPVAVYEAEVDGAMRYAPSSPGAAMPRPAFFTLDRQVPGTVAMTLGDKTTTLFAYPADARDRPAATVGLFEYRSAGRRFYATAPDLRANGVERSERPLYWVWKSP